MNLSEEVAQWKDDRYYARDIRKRFNKQLHADVALWEHRKYSSRRGMGEDCFHWFWKLLVDEMPASFKFLEIGVYKGQVLSLIRFLADRTGREASIVGVTLLNTFAGSFPPHEECNYYAAIKETHDHFDQPMPTLIVGSSTDDSVHSRVSAMAPFDMIYVDGCHDYAYVLSDLLFYPTLVRMDGFLVVDDAANNLKQPFGFFHGIESVTRAVQTIVLTDARWAHEVTVCHDRAFRKVA